MMMQLKEIYNLKNDNRLILLIQESALDKKSKLGLKIENDLLFGATEWFDAIKSGLIPIHVITGIVSRVYMSGHNDYPEFEIENEAGKTIWERLGNQEVYKVGENIELSYVEQKYKRPLDIGDKLAKCVIQIKLSW
jgi:hypothetical protein